MINKSVIIMDWLDGTISSDELSLYLKHQYELVKVKNPD